MNNPLSVHDDDLAGFFGAEPQMLDPGEPWAYNDAVYAVRDGRVHLSLAVAPAYHDVRILLTLDESVLYELNASGVADLRLHNENGRESLEIAVSERESIWVRLQPAIAILQTLSEMP
jgi:hypothetical protein